jgi:hypothetical protein
MRTPPTINANAAPHSRSGTDAAATASAPSQDESAPPASSAQRRRSPRSARCVQESRQGPTLPLDEFGETHVPGRLVTE